MSENRRVVQAEAGSVTNEDVPPAVELPPVEQPQEPVSEPKPKPKDAQVRLDPVATGLAMKPIPVAAIRTVAVNGDGTLIAIGTGEGEIAIWSEAEEKFVHNWVAHGHWVFDLTFDSNSEKLISAGGDNLTKIWAVDGWKELHSFADHDDDVHGVAITADSRLLVTGSDDMTVAVRDLKSGKVTKLEGHEAQVTSVVLSPDGKRAYSSSRDQTIRVWDLEKLEEVAVLEGHREDVLHLAIDRSGKFLASASYDGAVRIWPTGHDLTLEVLSFENNISVLGAWMLAVEFSRDASMVFVGSNDGLVRAFDRKTAKKLWHFSANSLVSDLALMPDGKQFIASTSANGMSIYDFTTSGAAFVRHVTRQKTPVPYPDYVTLQEYLNMHNALLFEQDAPDWGKKVGLLSIHGDIWTRHLLAEISVDSLPAPKKELVKRLRDQLYAKNLLSPTALQIGKFWGRLAVAEQQELKVAVPLKEWVEAETRKLKDQVKDPAAIIPRIEKKYRYELTIFDELNQDNKTSTEANDEVLKRLHAILEE